MLNRQNTIKNILWIIVSFGGLIYIYLALLSGFSSALFSLILTLFIFVIFSLLLDVFDIKEFTLLLSVCGLIVSTTTFFYYGIEEVAYPYGAIVFHFDGILKSLIMLFISSLPILFLYKGKNNINNNDFAANYDDSEWEIATADDLGSGQYDL